MNCECNTLVIVLSAGVRDGECCGFIYKDYDLFFLA